MTRLRWMFFLFAATASACSRAAPGRATRAAGRSIRSPTRARSPAASATPTGSRRTSTPTTRPSPPSGRRRSDSATTPRLGCGWPPTPRRRARGAQITLRDFTTTGGGFNVFDNEHSGYAALGSDWTKVSVELTIALETEGLDVYVDAPLDQTETCFLVDDVVVQRVY